MVDKYLHQKKVRRNPMELSIQTLKALSTCSVGCIPAKQAIHIGQPMCCSSSSARISFSVTDSTKTVAGDQLWQTPFSVQVSSHTIISPFASDEYGCLPIFHLAAFSAAIRCRTKLDTFSLSELIDKSCSIVTITQKCKVGHYSLR